MSFSLMSKACASLPAIWLCSWYGQHGKRTHECNNLAGQGDVGSPNQALLVQSDQVFQHPALSSRTPACHANTLTDCLCTCKVEKSDQRVCIIFVAFFTFTIQPMIHPPLGKGQRGILRHSASHAEKLGTCEESCMKDWIFTRSKT